MIFQNDGHAALQLAKDKLSAACPVNYSPALPTV
jgi:hypothetical protein